MTHVEELTEELKPLIRERAEAGLLVGHDPVLLTPCEPLTEVDDEALEKMIYMEDTLLKVGGKALTANQIGWNKQVVVADYDNEVHYIINPEINIRYGTPKPIREHCLSLPGIEAAVTRYQVVHVKGYELSKKDGKYLSIKMDTTFMNTNAQMWQHEMEHIQGKLFIDTSDVDSMREELELKLSIMDSIYQELF